MDWSLESGWDTQHGGIFAFVDSEGKPPDKIEWEMKLWWVRCEAMYATLAAYHLSREKRYLEWFEKIYHWTMEHFPDEDNLEWFGYLHRDGSVALDLKGNLWEGPFHIPRAQLLLHLLLEQMVFE